MKKKDPLLVTDACKTRHRYKFSDFYCCSRCNTPRDKARPNRRIRHTVKTLLRQGRYE